MKALLAVAVVIAAPALAYLVARAATGRRARLKRDRTPWMLAETSDGELLTVVAVRPGEEPLLIGAVAFASEDFSQRIEDLRSAGEERLVALNRPRRLR